MSPENFSFTGIAAPWISGIAAEKLSFYLSGGVELTYADKKLKKPPLIELNRTELVWHPDTMLVTFGRQHFKDSAEFIASGLFDGINASAGFSKARLSMGVYYSGFLYKEQAEILLSDSDKARYNRTLDYSDMETYFASRRALVSLEAEFPDLTKRTALTLDALAQFDLNSGSDTIHSQYFLAHFFFTPVAALTLNLAGAAGVTEVENKTQISFAAQIGADYKFSGSLPSMLRVLGRWSSGAVSDKIEPFQPLSSLAQGVIFKEKLSGLAFARGSYTIRLFKQFSAEAGLAYFIRTDLETFSDNALDPLSKSRTLGGECYGSLVWAPDTSLRITTTGGAFFPQCGRAFAEDAPLRWQLGAVLNVSL
jgi:hypothetical protein